MSGIYLHGLVVGDEQFVDVQDNIEEQTNLWARNKDG